MSQPPLSQQIRALERELGVELLIRNRRRVELTAPGETFLQEARSILSSVDSAVELTRRAARGDVGQLSIGFVGSATYTRLPDILRTFRDHHPEVQLRLRELTTAAQLQSLRTERIDVGFIRPPVSGDLLCVETIQREPVVVALPEGHELTRRRLLGLTDLLDEQFILIARREAPGLRDSIAGAMAQVGGAPAVIQEVAEVQTIIGLVAAGLGISLVPASVAALERHGVAYRPLMEPAPTVELALAWRREDRSPIVERFLALARSGSDLPQNETAPPRRTSLLGGAAYEREERTQE